MCTYVCTVAVNVGTRLKFHDKRYFVLTNSVLMRFDYILLGITGGRNEGLFPQGAVGRGRRGLFPQDAIGKGTRGLFPQGVIGRGRRGLFLPR